MTVRFPVLAGIFMAGCAAPAHQAIIGTWKSDAGKTLESMSRVTDMPALARERFENDFYGHLVVEYRVDTVRARFDNANYDTGYQPYEVISVSDDKIVTREWNEILHLYETSTTYIDGECIYGTNAEYAFREYFCPLE